VLDAGSVHRRDGYAADADYSPRSWLIRKTGITRGAAVSWAKRAVAHPNVFTVLAAGDISESFARTARLDGQAAGGVAGQRRRHLDGGGGERDGVAGPGRASQ
jgi:hypothetical protein